jgi:hypothetical protein
VTSSERGRCPYAHHPGTLANRAEAFDAISVALRVTAQGDCTVNRMNLAKIVAEATIAGALGFTALGMGPGVANAAPPPPAPHRGNKMTATDTDTELGRRRGSGPRALVRARLRAVPWADHRVRQRERSRGQRKLVHLATDRADDTRWRRLRRWGGDAGVALVPAGRCSRTPSRPAHASQTWMAIPRRGCQPRLGPG